MRLTKGGGIRRTLNRPTPGVSVDRMLTYGVKSPRSTHTKPATCEEYGCLAFNSKTGWTITLPVGSDRIEHVKQLMRGELDGIRRLTAKVTRDGDLVHIVFPQGTPCTRATRHRVTLNRPELYVVRGGDWRGSTGVIRRHTKPEHWVEDMQTTLDGARRVMNGRS